jgi:hypothetical protein
METKVTDYVKNLIARIIEEFPMNQQLLDLEHKHLPYVFMGSFATLVQSLWSEDAVSFRKSVEIMNEMASHQDLEVANLLQVGVLEILCDQPEDLRKILLFASPQLIQAIKRTRI